MDDYYDPTVDSIDVQRALAQAAILRKQSLNAPQGQMVGGQFIAPSKVQQLMPVVHGLVADLKEGQASQSARESQAKTVSALKQWMASRPQEQTTYGAGEEGPTMTTTPPTDQQTMEWAARGLTNPLSKTLAAKQLEDTMVAGPIRAEKAADKKDLLLETNRRFDLDRESRRDNLLLQLNGRQQELAQRLAAAGDNAQLQATIRQAQMDTQREIAQLTAASRERVAGARNENALEVAGLKGAGGGAGGKPALNATQQKEMAGLQDEARAQTDILAGFDPKTMTGASVYAATKLRDVTGAVADKKFIPAIEFWRNFRAGDNVLRHGLFGSALTAGEQAAWASTTVGPNDSSAVIERAINTRKKIVEDKLKGRVELYGSGGASVLGRPTPAPAGGLPRATNRAVAPAEQGARDSGALDTLRAEFARAVDRRDMNEAEGIQREMERIQNPGKRVPIPAASKPAANIDDLLNKYK